jgi:hypothetical protein
MFYPEIEVSVLGRGNAREAAARARKKFRAESLGGRGLFRVFPHGKNRISQDYATWMQHFTACS